jgi:hypothetical protein
VINKLEKLKMLYGGKVVERDIGGGLIELSIGVGCKVCISNGKYINVKGCELYGSFGVWAIYGIGNKTKFIGNGKEYIAEEYIKTDDHICIATIKDEKVKVLLLTRKGCRMVKMIGMTSEYSIKSNFGKSILFIHTSKNDDKEISIESGKIAVRRIC